MSIEDCIALDRAIAEAEGWMTFDQWYAFQESISGQWDEFYRKLGLL